MSGIPLHPGIVHVPVGIAFVLPVIAVGVVVALARAEAPRWPFGVVVALLTFMTIGGFAAMQTGEDEEERVERVVDESLIHEHEEAAELFVYVAFTTLVISVGGLSLPDRWARVARITTAVASIALTGLAFRAGEKGGELVYRHGAAAAYTNPGSAPGAGAPARGARDDDD